MEFKELAKARYSLRKFSDKSVEQEKLQLVLEAGRIAPTAHNNQPQQMFVIQTEEGLAKADGCLGVHFHSPVLIVVAYDSEIAWNRETDGKNHGEIDAAIAATQMMLQAADIGLGTTYIGMFEIDKLQQAFPQMAKYTPIAVLALGYPREDAHPSRLHGDRKSLEEMTEYL